jgi:hypothetical protein
MTDARLKRRSTPARLHDATSQKTLIFILDTLTTSNPTYCYPNTGITSNISQEWQPNESLGKYSITTLKEEDIQVDHRRDGSIRLTERSEQAKRPKPCRRWWWWYPNCRKAVHENTCDHAIDLWLQHEKSLQVARISLTTDRDDAFIIERISRLFFIFPRLNQLKRNKNGTSPTYSSLGYTNLAHHGVRLLAHTSTPNLTYIHCVDSTRCTAYVLPVTHTA